MRNLTTIESKGVKRLEGVGQDGAWRVTIRNDRYLVIASDGGGWEHVSISHRAKCPSWEVMCRVKEIFFGDEECVMQLHPPKADWVNNHKYCLHLWKPINGEVIPRPPAIFVGLPGVDHTDIAKYLEGENVPERAKATRD